nr:hypothetical protein [Nocardioides marinisabuli]
MAHRARCSSVVSAASVRSSGRTAKSCSNSTRTSGPSWRSENDPAPITGA